MGTLRQGASPTPTELHAAAPAKPAIWSRRCLEARRLDGNLVGRFFPPVGGGLKHPDLWREMSHFDLQHIFSTGLK